TIGIGGGAARGGANDVEVAKVIAVFTIKRESSATTNQFLIGVEVRLKRVSLTHHSGYRR
ncbi:MAG: hypothetical protein ACREDW_05675, partial [Aestuariivirgaceae bacterium]